MASVTQVGKAVTMEAFKPEGRNKFTSAVGT
jgi:hypothetical protein